MQNKLKNLIVSSRPISWVNTSYPFAAGYLLLTHTVNWQLIVGTFYFLIPYNIMMYGINDVFDYESDMRNPRKGGIEGAVLPKEMHPFVLSATLIINLPFIIYFLTLGSVRVKLFLVFLLFMQLAYTLPKLRFKEKPFLDSITSSTHFVSPMVFGLLLAGWQPGLWPYVVSFFLWGIASHAYGAVQDIIPDREANIGSIARSIGAAWTVRLSITCYVVAASILTLQGWPVVLTGLCCALYALSIVPFINLTDKKSALARAGWQRFLRLNWFTGFVITITIIRTWMH